MVLLPSESGLLIDLVKKYLNVTRNAPSMVFVQFGMKRGCGEFHGRCGAVERSGGRVTNPPYEDPEYCAIMPFAATGP